MLVVVDGIPIGQSSHLILQHLFMNAWRESGREGREREGEREKRREGEKDIFGGGGGWTSIAINYMYFHDTCMYQTYNFVDHTLPKFSWGPIFMVFADKRLSAKIRSAK
jgi:hypothetical protein